jgi:carboxymethylenebutenolidase
MGLTIETVRYGQNGQYSGYFAAPPRGSRPLPAVLVLQEAWGLDAHIEDVARRFALAGYGVLAPDLYSTNGARPPAMTRERMAELLGFINSAGMAIFADENARNAALAKLPDDQRARVVETFGAMFGGVRDLGAYVPALTAAARFLREEHAATRGQKVGGVGYCMGGGLSALLACHDPQLACACVYYGSAPPADLVPNIHCPVYGFYGSEDKRINDGIPALSEAMKKAGKRFESHVYEGAQHAFFNDERPSYHVGASRDAFARTLEAFRVDLAGAS